MKKIAFVVSWINLNNNKISEDNRFITECLYKTAKKHFLKNSQVDFIFLTNGDDTIDGVKNIKYNYKVDNYWHATVMIILGLKFLKEEYDYIFVNDNDQIYINKIEESELLDSDFVFMEHYFRPSIERIHKEITQVCELNITDNNKNDSWTMGNFFGGKYEKIMQLVELTEFYNSKYINIDFSQDGFYCKYPAEFYIIKYIFENQIKSKRLSCVWPDKELWQTGNFQSKVTVPQNSDKNYFLSEFRETISVYPKNNDSYPTITNVKLLHNTKSNIQALSIFMNQNK